MLFVAALIMAAVALILLVGERLTRPPLPSIAQEEALEKIELLGVLRADWFHAGGALNETEARRAAERETAVHLLFLGVDRRKEERGRADAIHLLRLEPGRLTLFSLPRDALVHLRGDSRPEKLNHAYAYGGQALMIRTIEDLLKIKVDGYLEVDLQTFVQAARIAKVLTLDGRLVGAEEIFARIDGLLSWLRNRSLPGGDIRRIARQQIFILKALDWTLTLHQEHPRVLGGVARALLRLLPSDITERQIAALCQSYAGARQEATPPGPEAGAETVPLRATRHEAIASAERFILPGRVAWIDIRTGEEIATDTTTAVTGDEPRDGHRPATAFHARPRGATPLPTAAISTDTHESQFILSFYVIEGEDSLARRLRRWRERGLWKNYEDRDELLK
jgi:hypothetical protein